MKALALVGHLWWLGWAVLIGAVLGGLVDAAGIGAVVGPGLYVWLLVSIDGGDRARAEQAAITQVATMQYQAQLNAEAMTEAALRMRGR